MDSYGLLQVTINQCELMIVITDCYKLLRIINGITYIYYNFDRDSDIYCTNCIWQISAVYISYIKHILHVDIRMNHNSDWIYI